MLSPQAVNSESDEDYHSLSGALDEKIDGSDDAIAGAEKYDDAPFDTPEHPLKSMQGAFEESILESNLDTQRPPSRANAELRRQRLLDGDRYDDAWTVRWRQRPEAQCHPLLKLMAQIIFGMHLLQQNQAKSEQEVVKILQSHVDEVDNFLEQTQEDFDLAVQDIEERIKFLQLPMQHLKVFNMMLEDKQFRVQLLEGNEKIEKIIDRTARSMNAALLDVSKGRQATRELSKYIHNVQYTWPIEKPDLDAIYTAMRGNEEGWKKCYKDLQVKGNALGNKLIELGTIISEMSKMAAAASRRMGVEKDSTSNGDRSTIADPTIVRSRFNADAQASIYAAPTKDKPLPRAPLINSTAALRPLSTYQPLSVPDQSERPKTAGQISIVRGSGPLSSHPVDVPRPRSAGTTKANGTTRTHASQNSKLLDRSISAPSLVKEKSSFLSSSRDAISGSALARRFSLRKKSEPSPPSSTATLKPPSAPIKSSASSLKSASASRLSTVIETPKPPATNDAPSQAVPDSPLTALPEAKSRVPSFKPATKTRQSILSGMVTTTDASSNSGSIGNSLKRRTLSIRGIFGSRKGRTEPATTV